MTPPTVRSRRRRLRDGALVALVICLAPGARGARPQQVQRRNSAGAIADAKVTHWSARMGGDCLGIRVATVARIWDRWALRPRRPRRSRSAPTPLEARIRDAVGLCLDQPAGAVGVGNDDKTQIQALDRTVPILPLRPRPREAHS